MRRLIRIVGRTRRQLSMAWLRFPPYDVSLPIDFTSLTLPLPRSKDSLLTLRELAAANSPEDSIKKAAANLQRLFVFCIGSEAKIKSRRRRRLEPPKLSVRFRRLDEGERERCTDQVLSAHLPSEFDRW